jgi:hypothetical protein
MHERTVLDPGEGRRSLDAHIVQELSDFRELAGNGELNRAQVPVFSLCEEVIQNAAEEGSDVSFVVDDPDRDVVVDGSDVRLKQVFTALLSSTMRERGNGPVEARANAYRNGETADRVEWCLASLAWRRTPATRSRIRRRLIAGAGNGTRASPSRIKSSKRISGSLWAVIARDVRAVPAALRITGHQERNAL